MQMTYLAQTKGDRIQLPPAIAEQVRALGWQEIRLVPADDNESLTAYPLPHPMVPAEGVTATVDAQSGVSISEALRHQVSLNGQNVMVRFEGEVLKIYLRQVFKTLGFRPA